VFAETEPCDYLLYKVGALFQERSETKLQATRGSLVVKLFQTVRASNLPMISGFVISLFQHLTSLFSLDFFSIYMQKDGKQIFFSDIEEVYFRMTIK
jgi:hypothetical protein